MLHPFLGLKDCTGIVERGESISMMNLSFVSCACHSTRHALRSLTMLLLTGSVLAADKIPDFELPPIVVYTNAMQAPRLKKAEPKPLKTVPGSPQLLFVTCQHEDAQLDKVTSPDGGFFGDKRNCRLMRKFLRFNIRPMKESYDVLSVAVCYKYRDNQQDFILAESVDLADVTAGLGIVVDMQGIVDKVGSVTTSTTSGYTRTDTKATYTPAVLKDVVVIVANASSNAVFKGTWSAQGR
jgi:hypothetical protein